MRKRRRGGTRIIILRTILDGKDHEARWTELLKTSRVSSPAFTGHMKRLLRERLIKKKGQKKETRYSLTGKGLLEILKSEVPDVEKVSELIPWPTDKTFAGVGQLIGRLLASSLPSIQEGKVDPEILKIFEEADEKLRVKLAELQLAATRQHK
jgi:predicted transcriptional regulator